MRCRKAEKMIGPYLEGELRPRPARDLESHVEGCPSCRALLEDMRTIAEAAASLPAPEPLNDPWPNILAGAMAAREGRPAEASPSGAAVTRPPARFLRPALGTLCALTLVAAGVWIGLRFSGRGPAEEVRKGGPGYTMAKLDEAERYYQQAIRSLGEAMAARRDSMPPGALEVFEKSLSVVDMTIDACRRAVTAQPYSLEARDFLMDAYMDKVSLLDSALAYERTALVRDADRPVKRTTI